MSDQETKRRRREIETVIEWLADGAPTIDQPQHLLAELCERLAGGGLPLARVAVYVRTLHPCVMGRSFQWRPGKEVQVSEASYGIMETADFLESPNRRVMRTGVPIRRRIRDPDGPDDFPILAELRAEGMTDYFMQPIRFTNGEIHAVSWVTKEPGGFSDAHLEALDRINPAFARVTEIYALRRTARNILDTYLGPTSGERVLRGLIKRGDGDDIRAVIWFCDLRGSTPLADSLSRETFLSALNQFFEATAGAVLDHGGEVLRFMGDAALAIFPIDASEDGTGSEAAACKAALEAARDAITRMAMLNRTRSASGEPTLGFGIGLHLGVVMYGNIGVARRLEFTVIGSAANEAARIESLCKGLEVSLVISAEVACHVSEPITSLGRHALRGVGAEVEVFTLAELAASMTRSRW